MNDTGFLMQLMAENVTGFAFAFALLIDERVDSKAIDKDRLIATFRQNIDTLTRSSESQAIPVLKLINMMMTLNDSGEQQAMQNTLCDMTRGQ